MLFFEEAVSTGVIMQVWKSSTKSKGRTYYHPGTVGTQMKFYHCCSSPHMIGVIPIVITRFSLDFDNI